MPPEYRATIAKQRDKLFSGDEHVQQGRDMQLHNAAAFVNQRGGESADLEEYRQDMFYGSVFEDGINAATSLQLTESEAELFRRRFTNTEAEVDLRWLTAETFIQAKMRPNEGPKQTPDQTRIGAKKEKIKYDHSQKKVLKAQKKEAGSRFIRADELHTQYMHEKVLEKKTTVPVDDKTEETVTQQELLKRALKGDYSNLQQLDPMLRSVAAGKYMERLNINANAKTAEELVNALYKSGGVSQLMNPLFRLGVSILMRGNSGGMQIYKASDTGFWARVEDLCNQRIMSATIYAAPTQVGDKIGREELTRNRQSQIFMAKTLLAAHLGRLQKIDTFKTGRFSKQKRSEDWKGGVATAFAHCSRVAFTLPGKTQTLESMTGKDQGLEAGFYKRTAATHKLAKKKREPGSSGMVEKKSWGTFYGQRGMNVAIGGLGNNGVPGRDGDRMLLNDGSSGHLYMHVSEGGDSDYTGLLIGFESDSPGHINATGHTHDWRAKPEFASSFGGQRCDEIGDKYGGRVVDLSGMPPEEFEDYMQRLEQFMTQKMDEAERGGAAGEQAQTELMNLADKLSGQLMTRAEIDKLI